MKPSKVKSIRAKKAHFLLPKFRGITLMGVVYCQKKSDIEDINKSEAIDSVFKSHETIHVRQALSMGDSWLRFYINYIFNYIRNLPLIFIDLYAPYRLIPTEIEAYLNEKDYKYAEENAPVYGWKAYEKVSLSDKRAVAKEYVRWRRKKTFSQVLHEFFRIQP